MDKSTLALLKCMADGNYHSGEALGELLGVSRAAVWKKLQSLNDLGVSVLSQKGRGYYIPGGMSLLDAGEIGSSLSSLAGDYLSGLQVLPVTESTNAFLLSQISARAISSGSVCLAEAQTAGRGRRGRVWQSPFASNIYLSLAWRFGQGVAAMEGLSLAVGVALCEAFQALGYAGIELKWPNDLLCCGKKLGGVLLEISGDASGECHVVIGVGINVRMPETLGEKIDQPWIDLSQIAGDSKLINRNEVVSQCLNQLILLLSDYEKVGFTAYRARWESLNAHAGQEVTVSSASSAEVGHVLGVTDSGGLRLDVEGRERVYLGGEVSVRA